ncbi:hypothetical protein HHK36_023149 [Tetracentron sinense]|uniref:Myb/SANT-like domain-containing protein n=1 Tax=Tetracentron sinense TaxID=13715 RepID=A0A834YN72_TETSI|nr:hypothetical protein HHK36_023149 [Tetracentron sinense]
MMTNTYENNDNEVLEVGIDDVFVWSTRNEDKFIILMEEEVIKANRSTTTFAKATWRRIRETLNAQTNKIYNDVQLRNKFNQLKQRQGHFKILLEESGIGYNAVTGQVTATEEEWDHLSRVHKFVKRFKKKGCPHYDKLYTIFGDTTAIGANAHPSTQSPLNIDDEEDIADLNFEKSLVHDGLARWLHEGAKVIEKHAAQLFVRCQVLKLLASVLLCKIDFEGQVRKVVGCSCVFVKDFGEELKGLHIVQEHVKSQ